MPIAIKKPEKELFEIDYKSLSNKEVARKYGCSIVTINSWVKFFGIEQKRPKRRLNVGEKLGCWTIVESLPVSKFGHARWKVKCVCGKVLIRNSGHLIYREHLHNDGRCGCIRSKWTGSGEMSGKYWKGVIQKAKMRGIAVDITQDDAWNKFQDQKGFCALTNQPLVFGYYQTASLDRINSSLPYRIDNIQWVDKRINWMKNKFSQQEFIELCHLVSRNNE